MRFWETKNFEYGQEKYNKKPNSLDAWKRLSENCVDFSKMEIQYVPEKLFCKMVTTCL